MKKMKKDFEKKLKNILINTGDLSFRRRIVEIIDALDVKGNEKILDCGCGDGFYVMVLRSLYPNIEITGIDYDEKILAKAQKYLKQDRLTKLIKGAIYDLPFPDNYFDKIILSEVLEHLDDEVLGMREIYRVLKPKGILAITVPNHNYPFFWDVLNWTRERLGFGHFNKDNELLAGLWSMHLRLYYPDEISALAKQTNFEILRTKLLTHYCFPFSQIILHLGKRLLSLKQNSKKLSDTMEKFNWQKAGNGNLRLVRMGQKFMEYIDSFNENKEFNLNISSHGILLVCRKN